MKDAFHLTDQYVPKFQAITDQIAQTIQDPKARAQYQLMAAGHLNQFRGQLDTHEDQQRNAWYDQTAGAAIEQAQQSATVNPSPGSLATQKDTIDFTLGMQAQRKGWDANELAMQKDKAVTGLYGGAIDGLRSNNDFHGARQLFSQIKPELPGHTALSFGNTITRMEKQHAAEEWAKLAPQISDYVTAASYGLPAQMPDVGAIRAFAPARKDADSIIQQMVAAHQFGVDITNMGTMTLEQKAATEESLRPKEGGPGIAQTIQRFDRWQEASRLDDKQRQDMAGYAQANKLGYGQLTGDPSKDGPEFAKRFAVAPDLAHVVGSAPAITSIPERKALAASFDNQNATSRIKTLDAWRTAFNGNDDGFHALMSEITPHNPTVGMAGELRTRIDPPEKPLWYDPKFSDQSMDVSSLILKGEDIMHPKGLDKTTRNEGQLGQPTAIAMQNVFTSLVGRTFAGQPQMAQATFDAFRSAYAGYQSEKGDYTGGAKAAGQARSPDKDVAQKILDSLVGKQTTVNGQQLVVPQGMDPAQYPMYLQQAAARALTAAGKPADETNPALLQGIHFAPVGLPGSGVYKLYQGGNNPIQDANGRDVKVDMYRDFAAKGPVGRVPQPMGRPAMPAPERSAFVDNSKPPTIQ